MVEAVLKVTSKHQITIRKIIWEAMKLTGDADFTGLDEIEAEAY